MESPSSSLCNLEYEVTSSSFSDLIDCPVLGYSLWDRHLFMPDSCFEVTPATERFNDSLSPISPTDTEQSHNGIQGCSDDTSVESSEVGEVTIVEDNSSKKEGRGRRPVPSTLSREVISSYFHMPVCQVAEELGIGETTLKERQDFEENPKDALTRSTIGVLKNRHKLLSDMPGSNLDPETLCLRNAYFKLNYLKRKLRRAMISSSPSVSSPWTPISTACIGTEGDEEDMDIPLKELLRRSKASPLSFVNVVTPVIIEGVPPNG
ncbi:protein RKD2-like [Ipomoea triloba]|uniref:protein RKD2-like n=1 Tax=Ipomoea triloba TaxID=35885 RepID=UPI00125E6934|nr:protein RKD2-like [Ipomoea triloba]